MFFHRERTSENGPPTVAASAVKASWCTNHHYKCTIHQYSSTVRLYAPSTRVAPFVTVAPSTRVAPIFSVAPSTLLLHLLATVWRHVMLLYNSISSTVLLPMRIRLDDYLTSSLKSKFLQLQNVSPPVDAFILLS